MKTGVGIAVLVDFLPRVLRMCLRFSSHLGGEP